MRLSDILCVPSYREGFGQVVVEAGACGIPSIVSNIYGLKDTIIDKKTGLFFQLKNISDLKKKLEKLITNKSLRLKMGFNSKKRVNKYFLSKIIEKDQKNFYKKLIKDNL